MARNQRDASTEDTDAAAEAPAAAVAKEQDPLEVAATQLPACVATVSTTKMDLSQDNAKYKQFIATLEKKGFFKGLEKGSPGVLRVDPARYSPCLTALASAEEAARWQKARDTFVAKYGMPTEAAATDAPAPTESAESKAPLDRIANSDITVPCLAGTCERAHA